MGTQMAPVIRVSDETYEWLKVVGRPFETPEEAIRRLLAQVAPQPERATPAVTVAPGTRSERTLHVLLRNGLVARSTEIILIHSENDDDLYHARFATNPRVRDNVVWAHDGNAYSLSRLTEMLRDEWEVNLPGGALNGYAFWALASNPTQSLWDLAAQQRAD